MNLVKSIKNKSIHLNISKFNKKKMTGNKWEQHDWTRYGVFSDSPVDRERGRGESIKKKEGGRFMENGGQERGILICGEVVFIDDL
jgi:hypothetical protein